MGGRVVREAIVGTPLALLDSFVPIKFRGTWRHRNGQWYELDCFLCTSFFLKQMQHKGCTFAGTSDHMGKKLFFHVSHPDSNARQKQRRILWKQIHGTQRSQNSALSDRPNFQALRGVSPEASDRRKRFGQIVEACLKDQGAPLPETTPSPAQLDGPRDLSTSTAHCYTDGSAEDSTSTAGWGLVSFVGTHESEFFGPVSKDLRPTNNVAEICGLIQAFKLVLSFSSDITTVIFHYDSQYAAQSIQGNWQGKKNHDLIAEAQHLLFRVQTRVTVHWHWIRRQ